MKTWPILKTNHRPALLRAFSLLELLTVIAVMMILVGLAVPAFQALTRSGALTTGTQGLVDELNAARQTATSRHQGVELRFYEMEGVPARTPQYRAFQMFEKRSDGTLAPLGPLRRLPTGLILYDSDIHSSLLGSLNTNSPATGFNDPYQTPKTKVFSFRSDGSTDLDPSQHWFVTLIEESLAPPIPPAGKPAANWAVVRIDPVNGKAAVHRP